MGFTLQIGNAKLEYDKENRYLRVIAEDIKLENAPAFGEPTDYTNERWPSYTSWHEFTRFVGLEDMFQQNSYSEINLIREHPGFVALSEFHQERINECYAKFYKRYPFAKAGYSPIALDGKEDPNWPIENNMATRLEWLKFWVDYALENCEIPIFYNS